MKKSVKAAAKPSKSDSEEESDGDEAPDKATKKEKVAQVKKAKKKI